MNDPAEGIAKLFRVAGQQAETSSPMSSDVPPVSMAAMAFQGQGLLEDPRESGLATLRKMRVVARFIARGRRPSDQPGMWDPRSPLRRLPADRVLPGPAAEDDEGQSGLREPWPESDHERLVGFRASGRTRNPVWSAPSRRSGWTSAPSTMLGRRDRGKSGFGATGGHGFAHRDDGIWAQGVCFETRGPISCTGREGVARVGSRPSHAAPHTFGGASGTSPRDMRVDQQTGQCDRGTVTATRGPVRGRGFQGGKGMLRVDHIGVRRRLGERLPEDPDHPARQGSGHAAQADHRHLPWWRRPSAVVTTVTSCRRPRARARARVDQPSPERGGRPRSRVTTRGFQAPESTDPSA